MSCRPSSSTRASPATPGRYSWRASRGPTCWWRPCPKMPRTWPSASSRGNAFGVAADHRDHQQPKECLAVHVTVPRRRRPEPGGHPRQPDRAADVAGRHDDAAEAASGHVLPRQREAAAIVASRRTGDQGAAPAPERRHLCHPAREAMSSSRAATWCSRSTTKCSRWSTHLPRWSWRSSSGSRTSWVNRTRGRRRHTQSSRARMNAAVAPGRDSRRGPDPRLTAPLRLRWNMEPASFRRQTPRGSLTSALRSSGPGTA